MKALIQQIGMLLKGDEVIQLCAHFSKQIFIMNFQQYLLNQGLKYSTCKQYNYIVNTLIDYFGSNLSKVGYIEILDWLGSFFKKRRPNGGIAPRQAAVKKYFEFLINEGLIRQNPCKYLSVKYYKKPFIQGNHFTPIELNLLLQRKERYPSLAIRNFCILSLLIYQGLTPKEIINLRIKDFNLEEGLVIISNNGKARNLPLKLEQIHKLNDFLLEEKAFDSKDIDNFFFRRTSIDKGINQIQKLVSRMSFYFPERKLSPTSIRQSVIYNWLNHFNIPIEDAQLLAGHKNTESTRRYRNNGFDALKTRVNDCFVWE